MIRVTNKLKKRLVNLKYVKSMDQPDEDYRTACVSAMMDGEITQEEVLELTKSHKASDVFDDGGGNGGSGGRTKGRVSVKAPSARYNDERLVAKHAKTGKPVYDERGEMVCHPTQRDFARIGALAKHQAARTPGFQIHLTEHEKELVSETYSDDTPWCGTWEGRVEKGIPGGRVKTLLDDSTSGGAEVNPEYFDQAIVTFPLLHGEIFPFVDLREVPRGATVEAASMGNVTVNWGNSDASEISLFDTDTWISELNSTIHRVDFAVEVGNEIFQDTPVNLGQTIVTLVGEKMSSELDNVTVNGNGTTQPEGIANATGLASVPSENGASGPPTVDDYLNLLFSVGKQYRKPMFNPAFIANDTSYKRASAIKVDETSDQRLLFGMDVNSYRVLGWPYRIQTDVSNSNIMFGALKKYRMYRRMGITSRWETGGVTLARRNTRLFIAMGRFGGRVVDSNAFAITSDAQS